MAGAIPAGGAAMIFLIHQNGAGKYFNRRIVAKSV